MTRYYSYLEENILPSQLPEYDWIQCWLDNRDEDDDEPIYLILKSEDFGIIPVDENGEEDPVGKWMIFSPSMAACDALWPKLKIALYSHELWQTMKAATKQERNSVLTCVYSQDWRDIPDVGRVIRTLRKLDILGTLYYKADGQTHRKIPGSIYVCKVGNILEITQKGYDWYLLMKQPLPNRKELAE